MTTTVDAVSQGLAYLAGSKAGAINERARIIDLAERKVCFGHQETANCEHSVCFGMRDLIARIKREN
jgi:hypothetical protein